MLATIIFGHLAFENEEAYLFIKKSKSGRALACSEMLTISFDILCKDMGYDNAIPVIKEWLNSESPNVVRVVTEGLRTWTNRPFSKTILSLL